MCGIFFPFWILLSWGFCILSRSSWLTGFLGPCCNFLFVGVLESTSTLSQSSWFLVSLSQRVIEIELFFFFLLTMHHHVTEPWTVFLASQGLGQSNYQRKFFRVRTLFTLYHVQVTMAVKTCLTINDKPKAAAAAAIQRLSYHMAHARNSNYWPVLQNPIFQIQNILPPPPYFSPPNKPFVHHLRY